MSQVKFTCGGGRRVIEEIMIRKASKCWVKNTSNHSFQMGDRLEKAKIELRSFTSFS
jgi:hypothetical protein